MVFENRIVQELSPLRPETDDLVLLPLDVTQAIRAVHPPFRNVDQRFARLSEALQAPPNFETWPQRPSLSRRTA